MRELTKGYTGCAPSAAKLGQTLSMHAHHHGGWGGGGAVGGQSMAIDSSGGQAGMAPHPDGVSACAPAPASAPACPRATWGHSNSALGGLGPLSATSMHPGSILSSGNLGLSHPELRHSLAGSLGGAALGGAALGARDARSAWTRTFPEGRFPSYEGSSFGGQSLGGVPIGGAATLMYGASLGPSPPPPLPTSGGESAIHARPVGGNGGGGGGAMSERERALLARVAELEHREAHYRQFTASGGAPTAAPTANQSAHMSISTAIASARTWEWVGQMSPPADRPPLPPATKMRSPTRPAAGTGATASNELPPVDPTPPTDASMTTYGAARQLSDAYPVA